MQQLVTHALAYLERGWSVIPLEPRGKRPLVQWARYQRELATDGQVRAWWTHWPEANIGIVTGAISGVVVLDIDNPEGDQSLAKRGIRQFPATPVSQTGRGLHYYFRHPGSPVVSRTRVLPGLDMKGDGGGVAAPPSVHASGKSYVWTLSCSPGDVELGAMPEWLVTLLQQSRPAGDPSQIEREWITLLAGVTEGARNTAAARLAGRLLSRGFTAMETLAWLKPWNEQNRPPIEASELRTVVMSIARNVSRRMLGQG